CIASLRKLFLAAAGAKQDGQKSGFILFAFLRQIYNQKNNRCKVRDTVQT
ncbi:MAG: hypothetical protein ACJA0J_002538, partial [Bdellovibrionota bacterium]